MYLFLLPTSCGYSALRSTPFLPYLLETVRIKYAWADFDGMEEDAVRGAKESTTEVPGICDEACTAEHELSVIREELSEAETVADEEASLLFILTDASPHPASAVSIAIPIQKAAIFFINQ